MADQGLAATIANALAGNKEGYMPAGWNSFTHANTPADLVSKPGLFQDMFTDRTISLPNSPQMQQEMLDTFNNINNPFGTGFIKGSPQTYAGWNLNEKQAQEFENQINNIDMTNWDADYNLTANPSSTGVNPFGSMGANPHQDTFTAQEKTGAGFKPGHASQGVVGKAIADIAHAIFGKRSGTTTFGFGVPAPTPTPASTTTSLADHLARTDPGMPAPPAPASPAARPASPHYDGVSDHDPYGRKAAAAAASARKSSMARAAKARAKSKASKKGGGRGKGKAPGGAPKGGHHKGLSFGGGRSRGTSPGGAPRGGHHFGGGGDGGDSHGGGDGGSGAGGWT